jgi:ketosteroid isomerase-like protein
MTLSTQTLIARIESYYAAVDRLAPDPIVAHFTPNATMEIPIGDVRHIGHEAIRGTYERREKGVDKSFHGDFTHVVDADNGRAVTRLAVRRTSKNGEAVEMDCIALFTFAGELIEHIAIWMSGENTLK